MKILAVNRQLHNKGNSDMRYCSRSLKEEAIQCARRQYNLLIVSYWFTNAFVLHAVPYNNYYYPSTTEYLDELIHETIRQSKEGTPHQSLNIPDSLCSGYQRPDKAAAVSQHRSRFNPQ